MTETNKRTYSDNEISSGEELERLPKINCYLDTGKKFKDGNAIRSYVQLYKSVIYAGSSEDSPYGEATDKPCYRLNLGKYPKIGMTEQGVKTLIKGLQQLLKDFPLML